MADSEPLKTIRFTRGITQQQLSKMTRGRVSQAMISQIEHGTKHPSDKTKDVLAKALGMQAAQIAFGGQ